MYNTKDSTEMHAYPPYFCGWLQKFSGSRRAMAAIDFDKVDSLTPNKALYCTIQTAVNSDDKHNIPDTYDSEHFAPYRLRIIRDFVQGLNPPVIQLSKMRSLYDDFGMTIILRENKYYIKLLRSNKTSYSTTNER